MRDEQTGYKMAQFKLRQFIQTLLHSRTIKSVCERDRERDKKKKNK